MGAERERNFYFPSDVCISPFLFSPISNPVPNLILHHSICFWLSSCLQDWLHGPAICAVSQGLTLDLKLLCHYLESLDTCLIRDPAFYFCNGTHKLCSQSFLSFPTWTHLTHNIYCQSWFANAGNNVIISLMNIQCLQKQAQTPQPGLLLYGFCLMFHTPHTSSSHSTIWDGFTINWL